MLSPLQAKRSFGKHLCVRPSVLDGMQPPGEILIVADRSLPAPRHPAKSVQSMALVEVRRGGIHHLLAPRFFSKISYRLDGAHAKTAVEASLKALATGCQKIASPPVEADAIDKIR